MKFRNRAVTDISRQEVRDLFDSLKRKHGETTAASVMRTLRAAINTAMRLDETIGGNPVAALRVPSTKRRQVDALDQIGRAHVRTPVTNAKLVCRLLPEKQKQTQHTSSH